MDNESDDQSMKNNKSFIIDSSNNKNNSNKKKYSLAHAKTEGNAIHYKYKSENMCLTEAPKFSFLDYTFRAKRNKITQDKGINFQFYDYNFELEQTLKLNLDILLNFISLNTKNNNKTELINLLKTIIKKQEKRYKLKKEIKTVLRDSINKNDCIEIYQKKIKNQPLKYEKLIINHRKKIEQINIRIKVLNNQFLSVQQYINYKGFKQKNEFLDFIKKNIECKMKLDKIDNENDLISDDIEHIRTDNNLIIEERRLLSNKKNINLVRVIDFFRNSFIKKYFNIKKLRKGYDNLSKILVLLNLGEIVNFNSEKLYDDVSTLEIEFSKINKGLSVEGIGINNSVSEGDVSLNLSKILKV